MATLIQAPALLAVLLSCMGMQTVSLTGMRQEHAYAQNLLSKTTTRCLAADFTGDHRDDLFLLADGCAFVAFAPGDYSTVEVVPATIAGSFVVDLEFLPRSGADALLLLTTTDLRIVTFDSSDHSFVLEEVMTDEGWDQGSQLRQGDFDATAGADLIGISADQHSLLQILNVDGARDLRVPISIGPGLAPLEVVEWDGFPPQEIAVGSSSQVRIYNGLLQEVDSHPVTAPMDLLTLSVANDPSQRLAIVSETLSGYQFLHVIGHQVPESGLGLGLLQAVAGAAGDVDGDPDATDDLIYSNRLTHLMPVFHNNSASSPNTPFSLSSVQYYPASFASAAANQAEPCLTDWDEDGDLDLAIAVDAENKLIIQKSTLVNEDELKVQLGQQPGDEAWLVKNLSTPPELRLTFQEPQNSTFTPNGIEFRLYQQFLVGTPASGQPIQNYIKSQNPGYGSLAEFFTLPETEAPFQTIYWIETRAVYTDSQGAVRRAAPASFAVYTSDAEVAAALQAAGIAVTTPQVDLIQSIDGRVVITDGAGATPSGPPGAGGTQDQ